MTQNKKRKNFRVFVEDDIVTIIDNPDLFSGDAEDFVDSDASLDDSLLQLGWIPLDCPVCDLLMRGWEDQESFIRSECCAECEMNWAEYRRDAWRLGWRPSKHEVEELERNKLKFPVYLPSEISNIYYSTIKKETKIE